VRQFRLHLKAQFNEIYLHKQYHWIPETRRRAVAHFFKEQYGVPSLLYNSNEAFFLKLIYNTLKDEQLKTLYKVDQKAPLALLLSRVMGSMPSNRNLSLFFKDEAV